MKKTLLILLFAISGISYATVTGDPMADGWASVGHSLENGLYANGSANYGFAIYSANMAVTSGSTLNISDGDYSWQVGDSILGVGGQFSDITATEAGWSAFSGNAVNSLLTSATYGPKLQVKLGTADATWSASTLAPDAGNGSTSTSYGGDGTVHFRTSGWFHADTPPGDQVTDTTWSGNTGQLMTLDKDSHIRRRYLGDYITPDKRVARVIWQWDAENEHVLSWQLLLNTSLLDRMAPEGFGGLTPTAGDLAIVSVQDRGSAYTDAVIATIPEPATLALLGLGGLLLRRKK